VRSTGSAPARRNGSTTVDGCLSPFLFAGRQAYVAKQPSTPSGQGPYVDFAGVRKEERDRALATLLLAFSADPVIRWLYPEPATYVTAFPELVLAFASPSFADETVWRIGDFAAVAVWMRPGVDPDGDATVAHLEATVPRDVLDDLLALFGQMEDAHPATALWYLPWFGTDCSRQGEGLGSRLMRQCLDIVDRDHLPAYLDSTNPRNVPFYERHGFHVTGR
jgi:GNAT superfamily N-acetyltransferase